MTDTVQPIQVSSAVNHAESFTQAAVEVGAEIHRSLDELLNTARRNIPLLDDILVRKAAKFVEEKFSEALKKSEFTLEQRERISELSIGSAGPITMYKFDSPTDTKAETLLTAILHPYFVYLLLNGHELDGPEGVIDQTRHMLASKFMPTGASVPPFSWLQDNDPLRANAIAEACEFSARAARITITSREYVDEASPEVFANIRLAILAAGPQVTLAKIAHAYESLRRLNDLPPQEQERALKVAENVYVPLAEWVGWYSMAGALGERIFAHRDPQKRDEIIRAVESLPGLKGVYSDPKTAENLPRAIARYLRGIVKQDSRFRNRAVRVEVRIKAPRSVYLKLLNKAQEDGVDSVPVKKIKDLLAARIIIPNGANCLAVHQILKPSFQESWPEGWKDYITKPKENGYQGLHDVLRVRNIPEWPDVAGAWLEVQFRTQAQDVRNETDPNISHASYKHERFLIHSQALANEDVPELSQPVRKRRKRRPVDHRSLPPLAQQTREYFIKCLNDENPPDITPNIFYVFSARGVPYEIPNNIDAGLMDAVAAIYAGHSDSSMHARQATHARTVYYNKSPVNMDDHAAMSKLVHNGDIISIDPQSVDTTRSIKKEWLGHTATTYARHFVEDSIKKEEQRSARLAGPRRPKRKKRPSALGRNNNGA